MGPISDGAEEKGRVPRACLAWQDMLEQSVFGSEAAEDEAAGLHEHLAQCSRCRKYAESLAGLKTDLRCLSESAVEPDARLHSRWTAAVREQAEFGRLPILELLAIWVQHLRVAFSRNLKPVAILAPIWLLALFFRIAAPAPASGRVAAAHSPAAIVHLLRVEQQRFASAALRREKTEQKKPEASSPQPRSQRSQSTVHQACSQSREPFKVPTNPVCA